MLADSWLALSSVSQRSERGALGSLLEPLCTQTCCGVAGMGAQGVLQGGWLDVPEVQPGAGFSSESGQSALQAVLVSQKGSWTG